MKKLKPLIAAVLVAAVLAAPASVLAGEKKAAKPYPLNTCAVSGEKLGGDMGDPYVFVHAGREVMLCCKECKGDFEKNTAKIVAKIDEASKKVKAYTSKACIVTDEALGDHGDPYVFVHDFQEVKMCCKDCRKDFDKNPKKFLSKLAKTDKKAVK